MLRPVLFDPLENGVVLAQPVGRFLKRIRVELKKRQQMLVEPDGLVNVTIEQPFAMQLRLVDQAGQMNISAEALVGTAWSQFLHRARLSRGQWVRDRQRGILVCDGRGSRSRRSFWQQLA